jgi:transcriptional regulator with XRE-family HTH domain
MESFTTSDELEALLGEQLRTLRLRANIDQRALAIKADVAVGALKNLEAGRGTTVRTLVRIVRALGQTDWLENLSPEISVSPLQMLKGRPKRQRASSRKRNHGL